MIDRRLLINFDVSLLVAVILICVLGALNLNSIYSYYTAVDSPYFYRQIYWILIGLCFLFLVINVNYVSLVRYSYYIHGFVVFILFAVLVWGQMKFGSVRWITVGGFSFQPSEVAKISFILALAKIYSENLSLKAYTLSDLLLPVFVLIITFLPIYLQPDLGTAGIICLVFCSMIFFLNINKRFLICSLCLFIFLLPCFWFVLKDYQRQRIMVFINPDLDPLNTGYQVIQSKIAVGSGGFLGKGYKLGTQSQLRFLPEQHTDFVFSVWAEEWGLLGCLGLLFLFLFILYRGLNISYNAKSFSGSLVALGISFLVFWQFLINIFMTMGLFPVVGVPLPFFSYGGSSMVVFLFAVGLLLNINMRKFK